MSTYSNILVDQPLRALEPHLCSLYQVESLIPASQACEGDLLVSEVDNWTLLGDRHSVFPWDEKEHVELLREISALAKAQVRAVFVQTSVACVDIFVAECGRVLRRYDACEGNASTNDGSLPAWEEQIRCDPESAAYDLMGSAHFPPPPATGIWTSIKRLFESTPETREPDRSLPPLDSDLSKWLPRRFEFPEPQWGISTKPFWDRIFPPVADALFKNELLVCLLHDGRSLSISRQEVDGIAIDPFKGVPIVGLKDGRLLTLPESTSKDKVRAWSGLDFIKR